MSGLLWLSACGRLDTLRYEPPATPDTWCTLQPCGEVVLFQQEVLITQPSSTLIVYAFGLLTILCGLHLLAIRDGQRARLWWGIALLLWGVGALLAGSSYEGFGWYLKCQGRAWCTWTDGLEIAYLLLSTASIDAMLAGVVFGAVPQPRHRRALFTWAGANLALYAGVVAVGVLLPQQLLISFTLLVLFAAPNLILFFIINGRRYARLHDPRDRGLLIIWSWLVVTIIAYGVYLESGLTQRLFAEGYWFSQDDVLHLGLVVWILLIWHNARRIRDVPVQAG